MRRRRPVAHRGAAASSSYGSSCHRSRRGYVELRQPALPAGGGVVDHVVDAELTDAGVLAGRRRAVDFGAGAFGDLGGGDAHTPPAECTSTRSPACSTP